MSKFKVSVIGVIAPVVPTLQTSEVGDVFESVSVNGRDTYVIVDTRPVSMTKTGVLALSNMTVYRQEDFTLGSVKYVGHMTGINLIV